MRFGDSQRVTFCKILTIYLQQKVKNVRRLKVNSKKYNKIIKSLIKTILIIDINDFDLTIINPRATLN